MVFALMAPEMIDLLRSTVEGVTRDEVLKAARDVLGPKVTEVTKATMDGIAEIIAQGLESQIGIDGIMRELREKIGLRSDQVDALAKLRSDGASDKELEKARKRMIRERAELIARDQANTAMSGGEFDVMQGRGMKYKRWIDRHDARVSDGCMFNSMAGWIKIDDPFPSGHVHPARHPRCRCAVGYKVITGTDEREHDEKQAELRKKLQAARAAGDKEFHPYA
jgi:SPP1 gp7 family putative phage head morphogenesis protein